MSSLPNSRTAVCTIFSGHAAHTGRGDAARGVDRIDHAFGHVAVQVIDDDMSAVFGEQRCDGAANASPGACDDC
jgi:hypothetical protein